MFQRARSNMGCSAMSTRTKSSNVCILKVVDHIPSKLLNCLTPFALHTDCSGKEVSTAIQKFAGRVFSSRCFKYTLYRIREEGGSVPPPTPPPPLPPFSRNDSPVAWEWVVEKCQTLNI